MDEITTEIGKETVRDTKGRFLPGNCANPGGKPKGLKDKATKIKETLFQVFFEEYGDLDKPETMEALKDFARSRRIEFIKIVAGLLPKEMQVEGEGMGHKVIIFSPMPKEKQNG